MLAVHTVTYTHKRIIRTEKKVGGGGRRQTENGKQ